MVFYQCQKCNKKWQQPVNICPFCFSKIKRVKATKAKVVASSKVLIPSLLHPKVPYYALLIEDEYGNEYAFKSMERKNIGEELNFQTSDGINTVSIWKSSYDLLDAVENITRLSGLELSSNDSVLILPTLVAPVHNYFRENTSPEFLDAVLDYLKNIGVKKIKIATQSFSEKSIELLAQKSGLLDICLKHKIVPFDLAKASFRQNSKMLIAQEAFDNDVILNLSSLKSGRSVSCENIMKLIEKSNYNAFKYLYSEDYIVNELVSLKNIFTIGEAIYPQRSDSFPIFRSLVFGSRNALNLDAVFNATGMTTNIPKYLKNIDVSKIEVVGRSIDEVQRNIDLVL